MNGWEKNAVHYMKDKTIDACPDCGCHEVTITEHINGSRKSLTLQCAECKSWAHFDGFAEHEKQNITHHAFGRKEER